MVELISFFPLIKTFRKTTFPGNKKTFNLICEMIYRTNRTRVDIQRMISKYLCFIRTMRE